MTAPATASDSHVADWVIFGAVYAGIAIGTIPFTRLNRSAIALLGAIAVVAAGRLTFDHATSTIDWTTLALLFSLMIVSAGLRVAGFYTRVIELIVAHAHRPWTLLLGVIGVSAALSAVFANDIICLAFAPVLAAAMKQAGKKPLPYLIALATSSNIGSAATIIGNPQNMLIGQSAHLSFGHFTLAVLPLVAVCLALNVVVVAWVYRRDLFGRGEVVAGHVEVGAPEFRPWHVTKTLAITGALVLVFLFSPMPREIAALVAGAVVLTSRTLDPRKIFALVDWDLILLFIGLFIVIGDVQQHGLLTGVMNEIERSGVRLYQTGPFAAVTVVLSNVVSNVPAVLLLRPGMPTGETWLWYELAVVSTFAGNLTLLGSIANLIVAEQARGQGVRVGFAEYLKVGIPLTVATVGLAVLYFSLAR